MTSPAANRWPAFSFLLSPNKAIGERVGNGCRSGDITPLLCTASAVSGAAALKEKKNAIGIGKKGKAAVSQSAALPSKHPQKNLIVWPFAPSGKKIQLPVSSLSNG